MKRLLCVLIVAAGFTFVSAAPQDVLAATRGSAYDAKNAACKARAKQKHFGIHFVQRNRWIKDCIAGAA